MYTADQIREITEQSIQLTYKDILKEIFKECIRKAKDNEFRAVLYGIDIDDTLKKYLENLGYTLERYENTINYVISW